MAEAAKAPARRRTVKKATEAPAVPEVEEFPAPEHMDDDAAKVWREVVAAHHDPGRIVGPDLEAYCGQVAMVRDARARIAKEGTIIADERGKPEPHPAIALERAAQKEVRDWGDKFRGRPKREPAERRQR
ncbi:hypothetical protein SEA_TAYLORSIPHT_57 [Arthrobacter phage TaylorSipht]|nr:hypothetical protein SEA_TAYLORSIPHT_57 [Arthrobacter phage TaylorSipht]